jgi:hypothetical protein
VISIVGIGIGDVDMEVAVEEAGTGIDSVETMEEEDANFLGGCLEAEEEEEEEADGIMAEEVDVIGGMTAEVEEAVTVEHYHGKTWS